MRFVRVLSLVSLLFLAACASDKVSLKDDGSSGQTSGQASGRSGAGGGSSDGGVGKVDGASSYDSGLSDKEILAKFDISKNSIYFDYDRFDVRSEYRDIIQGFSRWTNVNPSRTLIVQGNTDERGGREYNLALGQKRAEAVVRALRLSGVADSRLEAVSFGKEKPRALESNEAAWQENRRADIVVR
jgi:peptidoglycan-associated lipoprotein